MLFIKVFTDKDGAGFSDFSDYITTLSARNTTRPGENRTLRVIVQSILILERMCSAAHVMPVTVGQHHRCVASHGYFYRG